MDVNSKKFCPLTQNECSDNCGVYDLIDKRCSIVTIARGCALIDADSITAELVGVRSAIIEVSKSVDSSF